MSTNNKKKLRIAVWHNLPSGGGKRQLYTHLKGLIDRGHYVEAWCPDSADKNFLPLKELLSEHVLKLGLLESISLSGFKFSAYRSGTRAMDAHVKECAQEINKGRFDVLFAGACLFYRTSSIGRYVDIPSVVYLGEPNRVLYEAMPELPWIAPSMPLTMKSLSRESIKAYIREPFEHNAIRFLARKELEDAKSFSRILVNSLYSREGILRTYNIEPKVCYLGVDTDYYTSSGEQKEKFIIGMGYVYGAKGIDRAIRAIAEISGTWRPSLVWIGNGDSSYTLASLIKLAQSFDVQFIPKINIPDREVISLLSRATAMVYTSRLEPFGLAPLEANACETPVVAIAEGGVRETIRHGVNGFLVNEDNPAAIASYLERFIMDQRFAIEMGKIARKEICERWNLEKSIDAIEDELLSASEMK